MENCTHNGSVCVSGVCTVPVCVSVCVCVCDQMCEMRLVPLDVCPGIYSVFVSFLPWQSPAYYNLRGSMTGLNTSFRSATPSNEGDYDDYWHTHFRHWPANSNACYNRHLATSPMGQHSKTNWKSCTPWLDFCWFLKLSFFACGWMDRNEEWWRLVQGIFIIIYILRWLTMTWHWFY